MTIRIRCLSEVDAGQVDALVDVLIDCVEGGASVSFMAPLTRAEAGRFWQQVASDVASGGRALLVAEDEQNRIVGTVQLVLTTPPNQPHRADVAKLLVHRAARGRQIATQLMQALEATALERKRPLLVLDTVTGGVAEQLYTRLGWSRVGVIPNYALFPQGGYCSTTVFYKAL